jgi:diaminopimelate decarboxylase
MLPETARGDLIAIRSAGAYGEVMSSTYNLRDKAESIT